MNITSHELSPEEIFFSIAPVGVPVVENTETPIIGQVRAMAALALGLGIPAKGYNVFIQGAPGTGRRTALLKALSDYTTSTATLQDIVYVSNFSNPSEPRYLYFPAGSARSFKQDIHALIEDIKKLFFRQQNSAGFKEKKSALLAQMEKEENRKLAEFESEALTADFQIVQRSDGEDQSTDIVPLLNGTPASFDSLQSMVAAGSLTTERWNALREKYYALMDRMKALFESLKAERADLDKRVARLTSEMIDPLIRAQLQSLKTIYTEKKPRAWLESLENDILAHLFYFTQDRLDQEQAGRHRRHPGLARYGVNIVVDRTDTRQRPVVFENRPTLSNLVGTIEAANTATEDVRTSYLRIRGGSLLKAAGGVLVIKAEDIVNDEEAWPYLKRVLQTGIVEIQNPGGPFQAPALIKPEALEIRVKVVLIGDESSYDLLYQIDPDFQKLFKICAEFDSSMNLTPESISSYTDFLATIVGKEKLRPINQAGIQAVLERAVRDTEQREKLSTRFSRITDLLREADWWAGKDGKTELDAAAIHRAVEMRAFMHKLPEENVQAMILSDEIILQSTGSAVGKANALAIHDRGYYAYGLPVVVSARVAPGDGGVINIEGESGLSGEIFDKAVLILSGYLRSRYARTYPLSITASVCFEQMYTPIDGDSATAVQLCTIISAISGLPLRQDLAMTGSVNQLGDMQPVGGISVKIEGFHAVCARRGLTGTQGVIIPRRNIRNVILSEPVKDDVRAGKFHLFGVDTIDQALEVLTGKESGAPDREGQYPAGSVNGIVSQELKRMADVIRRYET